MIGFAQIAQQGLLIRTKGSVGRQYSRDFKASIVKKIDDGMRVADLSSSTGLCYQLIYKWVNEA